MFRHRVFLLVLLTGILAGCGGGGDQPSSGSVDTSAPPNGMVPADSSEPPVEAPADEPADPTAFSGLTIVDSTFSTGGDSLSSLAISDNRAFVVKEDRNGFFKLLQTGDLGDGTAPVTRPLSSDGMSPTDVRALYDEYFVGVPDLSVRHPDNITEFAAIYADSAVLVTCFNEEPTEGKGLNGLVLSTNGADRLIDVLDTLGTDEFQVFMEPLFKNKRIFGEFWNTSDVNDTESQRWFVEPSKCIEIIGSSDPDRTVVSTKGTFWMHAEFLGWRYDRDADNPPFGTDRERFSVIFDSIGVGGIGGGITPTSVVTQNTIVTFAPRERLFPIGTQNKQIFWIERDGDGVSTLRSTTETGVQRAAPISKPATGDRMHLVSPLEIPHQDIMRLNSTIAPSDMAIIKADNGDELIVFAQNAIVGLVEFNLTDYEADQSSVLVPSAIGRDCVSDLMVTVDGIFCRSFSSPGALIRIAD